MDRKCVDREKFTDTLWKNSNIVGHVAREFSESAGTSYRSSEVIASVVVTGDEGKDWSVLKWVYVFKGTQKHLNGQIHLFAKLKA